MHLLDEVVTVCAFLACSILLQLMKKKEKQFSADLSLHCCELLLQLQGDPNSSHISNATGAQIKFRNSKLNLSTLQALGDGGG